MADIPETLAAALAVLQTRLPDIRKSQTAKVDSERTGKSYSYTYAGIAAVAKDLMPLLGQVGLSFTARPTLQGDRFVLAYSLLHTSGDSLHGEYPLPSPLQSTPQAVGSAITYARRYVLCAITGVVADEDDDGHAAAQDQRNRRHRQEAEQSTPETPTPEQVAKHAELLAKINSTVTEDGLRTGFDDVKAAFKAGELTTTQAQGLRGVIGERRQTLPGETVVDGALTSKTRAQLFALLGKADYKAQEERRVFASLHLDREVESMTTLTEAEGQVLIAVLRERETAGVPA